ncbi:uncharacterized protein C8Q71DRAFT_687833, partial [Rhodofomes roseus]
LAACLEPDVIQTLDTAQSGGSHVFKVLHFTWYNRHCTTGEGSPDDVPPSNLKRTGGLKTNYHQFIPYPSKDMTNSTNQSIYQSMKQILAPLFDWLDLKVSCLTIKELVMLRSYVRVLPGNNRPLASPFLGLVVNMNVTTAAHRDGKDDGICLVLAIGDFEGGELVLYEPGLIVPLWNGDFILFPSCDLTHFNLHY